MRFSPSKELMVAVRKVNSSRTVAVELLTNTIDSKINLDIQLHSESFLELSRTDQRLAKRLTDGVLRNMDLLDYWIGDISSRSLKKIDREILWILRIGLYQISFLRIPEYAAVKETAELCRAFRKKSAVGFVNGILRTFLRKKPKPPNGNSLKDIAIRNSHPTWLVRRYLKRYGPEKTSEVLERNNQFPDSVVWINPFLTDRDTFVKKLRNEEIPCEKIEGLNNAVRVKSRSFDQHHLYQKGHCFFMEAASQMIANWPELEGRDNIADLCSAPGGKSFILASKCPDKFVACGDTSLGRLKIMQRRSCFHKIPNLLLFQSDLQKDPPFDQFFDFLLLDVPCSGLGTISSNPEIRWLVCENDLKKYQSKQLRILENGFSCLRQGGQLVYSTCSTEPEENEEVIQSFLSETPVARLVDYFLSPEPGRHGFFGAALTRI